MWILSDPGHRRPYGVWLGACALLLMLGACATPPSRPGSMAELAHGASVPGTARERVVATALAQVGTPYRFGGDTPLGFDCSGLVRYAHGAAHIPVPRQTHVQAATVRPLDREHLQPGDLLFFRINGSKPAHVSIYVGDGRFVHAPSSGGRVHVERLDHPYWAPRLLYAGHYFSD